MNDPVLGALKPDPQVSGCMLASIPYQGREIDLRVDPGNVEMEGCLNLARDFVASLKLLETKARLVAAEKLIDEYNEDWRMFSRARADGSMEDVTDPMLTSIEFSQRLELRDYR
jgi:hypothetical protein